MVVVTFPSVTFGAHLQDAVDQITDASATLGMSVVVRFAGRDSSATLTSVLDLRPMVVIDFGVFTPEQVRTLEVSGSQVIPHAPEADGETEDEIDLLVGRLQVRELTRREKRRVIFAHLQDSRAAPYGDHRLQGVRAECQALNLPEPIVIRVQLNEDAATEAIRAALELTGDEPVAVCAYNDDVAIAVLAAARRLNRDVPAEVGVMGVDHTTIGQLVEPRLATVHIDLRRMIDVFLQRLAMIRSSELAPADAVVALVPEEFVWVVAGDSC